MKIVPTVKGPTDIRCKIGSMSSANSDIELIENFLFPNNAKFCFMAKRKILPYRALVSIKYIQNCLKRMSVATLNSSIKINHRI